MATSKHSEEEILKLGEKLIEELNLEYSVNTLARWLAHYIAELMHEIENSGSKVKQAKLKQECCDSILKIWKEQETLPIQKPLERLKPIIHVLELLKKREHPLITFSAFNDKISTTVGKSSWEKFLEAVCDNSDRIFRKSLSAMLDDKVLKKDREWIKNHGNLISKEEKEIFKLLETIQEIELEFVEDDGRELSESEKKQKLFSDLENLIAEQKQLLLALKQEIF